MEKLNTQQILRSLITIESTTENVTNCLQIIKMCKQALASQKIPSKILQVNNRPILVWGETNLAKSNWLVNSHLDVVPGKPEQFKPRIKGNKLWGRGSADTKAAAAALLANAADWTKIATDKQLTFMLVTDEEIGGNSTKQILETMSDLKGAIFLEPTEEKIITKAKGIMQIKIRATGKSSHGSRPWDGKNALEQITNHLNSFKKLHPSPRNETRATTYNFSLLQAGTAINQVPAEATLWCDVRWNPKDNPQTIINEFKKLFSGSNVEVVKLESPCNCPKDSTLLKNFSKAMRSIKIAPRQGFEHGSSDARHCTDRNIPAIVFGPKGKNPHTDNEWVDLKSLERVSKVLETWITLVN